MEDGIKRTRTLHSLHHSSCALLQSSGLLHHMYADDTQLYISFSAKDSTSALSRLTTTFDSVHTWLTRNRLALNPAKTEFLLIGLNRQRQKLNFNSFSFAGSTVSSSSSARNLGVIFDRELSFDSQISAVTRSCYHVIRQLRQIRPLLDHNMAVLLANCLVSSRLDFCNSLFYGLPDSSIRRLQLVQNSLARVIFSSAKKPDHISPPLHKLHWLPIEQRIIFKAAVITFKVLHSRQPAYLADLITPQRSTRDLRSNSQNLLVPLRTKLTTTRR